MSGERNSSATATTGIAETPARPYCGRFAPSPTGALHFGSLVAALGSFLEARTRGGRWLVRIEDLDPPRVVPGADDDILRTLERSGLDWDGTVTRQSARHSHYDTALDRLRAAGATRLCSCTRSALKALPENRRRPPGDELFHPRECVTPFDDGFQSATLRLRVPPGVVTCVDRSLGRRSTCVETEVGDFVLRRRDGLHAYQLAVVVDDAEQGVTDVVRGADLWSSTARQAMLQRCLDLPATTTLHLPLAVTADGTKLSKSGDAPSVALGTPAQQVWRALDFLGQHPPPALRGAPPREVVGWGLENWQPSRFAGVLSRSVGPGGASESRLQEDTE